MSAAPTNTSETWRISCARKLEEWLASEDLTLNFPANLSKEERRYLHETAPRMGLITKSVGSGETRYITVSKPMKAQQQTSAPTLKATLTNALARSLRDHATKYPPDDDEKEALRRCEESQVFLASDDGKSASKKRKKKRPTSLPLFAPKDPSPEVLKKRKAQVKERCKLPAWAFRDEVAKLVKEHPVVLVSGATGCGKSTQVPQFVLDSAERPVRIACSQPRRLSAIAVAERVAFERGEKIGDSVGYEVRFERCVGPPEKSRLVFATPGVLLRKLASKGNLDDFTHIIIDEVHEEDKDTEFLVIACRELAKRGSIQLILMSATLAVQKLVDYFDEYAIGGQSSSTMVRNTPTLSVGSRTFPVECFYLEDVLRLAGVVDSSSKDQAYSGALDLSTDEVEALSAMAETRSAMDCPMCGKKGFQTPQELGDHAADCDGQSFDVANSDPDGFLDDDHDGVRDDLSVFIDVAARGNAFLDIESTKISSSKNGGSQQKKNNDSNKKKKKNKANNNDDDNDDNGNGKENPASDDDDDFFSEAFSDDDDDDDDEDYADESAFVASSSLEKSSDLTSSNRATEAEVRAYQRSQPDDESVDAKLVCGLLRYITKSAYDIGAVLVFVSGWADIVEVVTAIEEDPLLKDVCLPLALHSSLETSRQRLAFAAPPPGKWKVVVATNVAETSITIPDVSFVIDSGLEKTQAHDVILGASVLRTHRIAKSSADQRLGRAGRTRPGLCFRLWTRRRHRALEARRKSELLRANLDGLCLQAATLDLPLSHDNSSAAVGRLGARDFLRRAINPPPERAVDRALRDMVAMGALFPGDETPTALGEALSTLPLPPRLGLAALYCRLLGGSKEDLAVPCVLEAKDPFAKGSQATATKQRFAQQRNQPFSDVAGLVAAYAGFLKTKSQTSKQTASSYCRSNGLNFAALSLVDAAVKQIDSALPDFSTEDNGGATTKKKDGPSSSSSLSRALAVASLYPNVASRLVGENNYVGKSGARCRVHHSCLASKRQSPYASQTKNATATTQFLAFGALLEYTDSNGRSGLCVATVAPADPLAVALLCHGSFKGQVLDDTIKVDLKVASSSEPHSQALFDNLLLVRLRLRKALANLLASAVARLTGPVADALNVATNLLLHDPSDDNSEVASYYPRSADRNQATPSSTRRFVATSSPASASRGPQQRSPMKTSNNYSQQQRSGGGGATYGGGGAAPMMPRGQSTPNKG